MKKHRKKRTLLYIIIFTFLVILSFQVFVTIKTFKITLAQKKGDEFISENSNELIGILKGFNDQLQGRLTDLEVKKHLNESRLEQEAAYNLEKDTQKQGEVEEELELLAPEDLDDLEELGSLLSNESEPETDLLELNEMLKDLLEDKLNPKEGENCPEYVNCMPSIGEAPNCEIPLGCEGLTEKVY